MDLSKLMRILLFAGNLIVLILAIIILSLSIGHWHEYAGGALSLIVAIFGLFVVCLYSHVVIFGYAVLVGVDLLVMLANGIYLAILKSHYSDFCFDHDMDFSKSPIWGCADWRHGHYERATGVMVCLFLAVLLRALNFASACLLGKNVYDDQYDDGVGDIRKTHDLAERGRQF